MNNVVFGRLNEKIVPIEYTGVDTDTADITVDNDNKIIKVDVRGTNGVVRYDKEQYLSFAERERARNNIGVVDYVGGTTETAEVHINEDTISVDVTNVGEIYTAGDNIQISANNVISATDTTYDNLPASEDGSNVSLVTTGEKYTWDNKQDALVSGTNIKTINNESVLGSGNISIVSYHNFNPSWTTAGTTEDFCSSIVSDSTAVAGMTYLGKLMCSDLPGGLIQGEAIVEIISDDANGKAIDITLTSVTNSPYRWTYARAKVNGSYVNTGWKAYQLEITSTNKLSADLVDDTASLNKFVSSAEKFAWNSKQNALVSGSNIKTINNTSILGAGNIDTTYSAGDGITLTNTSFSVTPNVIDATNDTSLLPSSANTSGIMKFVLCSSEPATKYNGYLYLITGA